MTDRELLNSIAIEAAEAMLTMACNPQYCNKEYAISMIKLWLWEWGLRKNICPFCNLPLLPLPKREDFFTFWVCPSEGCRFNK